MRKYPLISLLLVLIAGSFACASDQDGPQHTNDSLVLRTLASPSPTAPPVPRESSDYVAISGAASPATVSGAIAASHTPLPTPMATEALPQAAGVEAAARKLLADQVGPGAFILESAESLQWPDASLGCPQPGYAYAQVVTPGRRLIFTLGGAHYPVHTNADASHLVICADH